MSSGVKNVSYVEKRVILRTSRVGAVEETIQETTFSRYVENTTPSNIKADGQNSSKGTRSSKLDFLKKAGESKRSSEGRG